MNRRDALAVLIGLSAALSFAFDTSAHGEEDRLAIKGYDPVAYFTEAKPMIGDPQYQYVLDGALYRFSSTRHLDLFKADPDRYAAAVPKLVHCGAVEGYRLVADPNHWLISDEGRLYLLVTGRSGGSLLPIRRPWWATLTRISASVRAP